MFTRKRSLRKSELSNDSQRRTQTSVSDMAKRSYETGLTITFVYFKDLKPTKGINMDEDCKSQINEIVASIAKIPGKMDELIREQKLQNEKLDAIQSRLASIEEYIAGRCD